MNGTQGMNEWGTEGSPISNKISKDIHSAIHYFTLSLEKKGFCLEAPQI